MNEIIYRQGIPKEFVSDAIELYDEAFGKKISLAIKSNEDRKKFLSHCFLPEYSISALMNDKLVGIAGFQTPNDSMTGKIGYKGLISQLGLLKGNWAALIFSIYERTPQKGELVMDGIAVHSVARGKGIGNRLLDEIKVYAVKHQFESIRLDVIDINPRAKKLYERKGFEVVRTEKLPYLKFFLGFGGYETMKFTIKKCDKKI